MLALLLVRSGQTVPVPDLLAELWGGRPPRSALTTLQTYILNLRKLLSRALAIPVCDVAGTMLATRPGGYLLHAQRLWRGPALTDVRPGRVLEPDIKRLEEARLATITQSIEVRLRLGRHHELLSELSGLVTQYRMHENLPWISRRTLIEERLKSDYHASM